MAQTLTQDKRLGQLTTPLGKDVLVLVRFDGTEGLSELFEYRIEALSEEADIDFDNAIGQQCSLKFKFYGQVREFNGILVEAQWMGVKGDYYSYRIVLRPWLWLLSQTTDCRIFQDKKAPEIIKEVFQDRGFTDFESKLTDEGYTRNSNTASSTARPISTSYSADGKRRHLLFLHTQGGKHTLVLADSKSSHKPVPSLAKIPLLPAGWHYVRKEQHIYEWISERRFGPEKSSSTITTTKSQIPSY